MDGKENDLVGYWDIYIIAISKVISAARDSVTVRTGSDVYSAAPMENQPIDTMT